VTFGGALGEFALGEFLETPVSELTGGGLIFEMYVEGDWEDFSGDVRAEPFPRVHRGIEGSLPTDRMASTGTLTLTLDNSHKNSAGLLGYYSPDNANCRTDFGIGTPVRFSIQDTFGVDWYKFHGKIADIEPEAGEKLGRGVAITAVDYMDYLATTNLTRLAVQLNKRPDEIIDTIVDSLPIAPITTLYATSTETLAYALHRDRDEKTSAMNAIQKVLQSDMGYLFVSGDTISGETLTYQNKYTRLLSSSAASLSDDMRGLSVHRRADIIYNDIRVAVYPVRVDSANVVLATAQTEFSVDDGDTLVLTMRYRDPSGAATRISLKTQLAPVDGTDYEFTATPGSGNNDLTPDVSVSVDWGSNSAEVTIVNSSGGTAYSGGEEVFRLRGKAIYTYDPIEIVRQDATSIAAYGLRTLLFSMPYQSDLNTGAALAEALLQRYKDPWTQTESVTFDAIRSDTFHDYAAQLDIGDRLTLAETVTGINSDFFINSVDYELHAPDLIVVTWGLENIGNTGYWILEDATLGILELTTILGF
jgi:hypothetical protein